MNNITYSVSEGEITSVLARAGEHYAKFFPELDEVKATAYNDGFSLYGYTRDGTYQYTGAHGPTLHAAAVCLREKVGTPEARIKAAREQAAKLLAEADALEAAKN